LKGRTLIEFMDAAAKLPSWIFVRSELWSSCRYAYFSTVGDVLFLNQVMPHNIPRA